ncbi:hypothetical protein MTO96_044431 [Rhipicephalus appendiculatus]
MLGVTVEEMRKRQEADSTLRRCLERQGKWLQCNKSRAMHRFERVGGLLYRTGKFHDGDVKRQPAVPWSLRRRVLNHAHAASEGHLGVRKMIGAVAEKFWWPYKPSDVKRFVKACGRCQ